MVKSCIRSYILLTLEYVDGRYDVLFYYYACCKPHINVYQQDETQGFYLLI